MFDAALSIFIEEATESRDPDVRRAGAALLTARSFRDIDQTVLARAKRASRAVRSAWELFCSCTCDDDVIRRAVWDATVRQLVTGRPVELAPGLPLATFYVACAHAPMLEKLAPTTDPNAGTLPPVVITAAISSRFPSLATAKLFDAMLDVGGDVCVRETMPVDLLTLLYDGPASITAYVVEWIRLQRAPTVDDMPDLLPCAGVQPRSAVELYVSWDIVLPMSIDSDVPDAARQCISMLVPLFVGTCDDVLMLLHKIQALPMPQQLVIRACVHAIVDVPEATFADCAMAFRGYYHTELQRRLYDAFACNVRQYTSYLPMV